jgi:5'-nucleotidase
MEDIVIACPSKFEKMKKKMIKNGRKKLLVISDFDGTLTKAFVNHKRILSLMAILRDGNYITRDYAKKAHKLFERYHPIEKDQKIPLREKDKLMHEWWTKHFELLIKSKLSKKELVKIAKSKKIKFRRGVMKFIDFLNKHKIPLLIFSSSGIGGDLIPMLLKSKRRCYKNIHIISNYFIWNKNGVAIDVKKPIIHVMKKDMRIIHNSPIFKSIKNRKNVILLGDSLNDTRMIRGFAFSNLIKIGFLNEEIEKRLDDYKKKFEIVILNDASMYHVNNFLREIVR